MDEAAWLACADPQPMLSFLRGRASARKLRLLAVACCRRIWQVMEDERSRGAIEIAERFVDGNSSPEELDLAWRNSWVAQRTANRHVARSAAIAASAASTWYDDRGDVYRWLEEGVAIPAEQVERAMRSAEQQEHQAAAWNAAQSVLKPAALAAATGTEIRTQAELLHDVIGNPFRPVTIDSGLQTPAVLALAQAAYDHRTLPAGTLEPDRLAVLADALEEAGCTDADILGHLRGPELHYRGCWCVDTLLNKS
jgi:hypothetical protein